MRAALLALVLAGACTPAPEVVPPLPRVHGVELTRGCAAWTDEPSPLPSDSTRTHGLEAGHDLSCVIVDGGRVACWGWNDAGRLVGGDREFVDTPALVRGLEDAAQVRERCARTDHGTVYCWDAGPLDAGGRRLISDYLGPLDRARIRKARAPCGPVRVPGLEDSVELEVGAAHACVLQSDGRVHCWGDNGRGQLGRATASAEDAELAHPVPGLSDVRDVAVGDRHSCALLRSGQVACWGDNGGGQLGIEGPRFTARPQTVPGIERVLEVDAGVGHTCARRRDGTVACWGQVGARSDDTTTARCGPAEVPDLDDAVQIAAGGFDCARRRNGKVVCWRELDCAATPLQATPAWGRGRLERLRTLERATEIAVGTQHACARSRAGRIACWGEALSGGLGATIPRLETTSEIDRVPALREPIGSGAGRLCGLDRRRRLVCVDLSPTPPHGRPQPVPGIDGPVAQLVQAPLLDCARSDLGEVACWGSEGHALPVLELEGADRIYPLWSSAACAHQTAGGTVCWGAEVTSMHSDSERPADVVEDDTREHWHAEPVATPVDVVQMALDGEAVCGLTPAGQAVCWPLGASEDPFTFSRLEGEPSPPPPRVEVASAPLREIVAASRGFCGRTDTGEIVCWRPRFDADPTPVVPAGNLAGATALIRGALASELCTIDPQGAVLCFSPGFAPESPPPRLEPSPLGIDGARTTLHLGGHPCVLRTQGRLSCWGGPFREAPLGRETGLFVAEPVEIPGLGRSY